MSLISELDTQGLELEQFPFVANQIETTVQN